ncbi:MAG: ribonuclease J [Trueperaceae bacterium]|nr:ribonuclease J [Trueperaceae bacterium]
MSETKPNAPRKRSGGSRRGGRRRGGGGGRSKNAGPSDAIRIIPFGGMGEIGKNMFAFEYGGDILMVDGGLAFPDADMLGVDLLVPKVDWLIENIDRVKGWVLTHGHEDHIGGLPYILKQLPRKIPMYGAKLTLGLLRGKFDEFKLTEGDVDLREITPDDRIKVSDHFTVDFFRMTHSIPDNSGLIIHTPIGRIVHSGDFKLDYHPADGKTSHLAKIAAAGAEGVLLLLSDSTNGERPGFTPSERDVMMAVDDLVGKAPGRVIVTTFSSHVHRIQNFVRVAEAHGRRVAVEGRSMVKATRIAQELGYLESKQPILSMDQVAEMKSDRLVIITTGSQGQPMAALSRLAAGTHRKVELQNDDTIIMSSNPIPGNEEAVNRVINQLYERGVKVLYPPKYKVHASGHGSQEELKLILDLARPKYFIPWHGEPRHQVNHAWLAESMPRPPKKTVIPTNGSILELSEDDLKVTGEIEGGVVYIDSMGRSTDEIQEPIIRDRQTLSSEGVVVIMGLMGKKPSAEVIVRGVAGADDAMKKEVTRLTVEALAKGKREKRRLSDVRDDIFYPVRRYLRKATGRTPLIVPTVVEN